MTSASKAALAASLLCIEPLIVADDVTTLIYRARQKALEDMRSLDRCVCQETVNRYRFKAKLQQQKPIVGCAGTPADTPLSPGFDSSLVLKDRLRFDVSIAPNGEMFSWASASQFVSSDPAEIVEDGALQTGDFGPFVISIFGGDSTTFRHLETLKELGNTVARYSYLVPHNDSHYMAKVGRDFIPMGYEGEVWIDVRTAELTRLTAKVAEPPQGSLLCQISTDIRYKRVSMSGATYLLPSVSVVKLVDVYGGEAMNEVTYSNCHEFHVGSTLSFNREPPSDGIATKIPTALNIRALTHVRIQLLTQIDFTTAAAGDHFKGRTVKPVRDASGSVTMPAGTFINGSVMRFEERFEPSHYYVLGLMVDNVEIQGRQVAIKLAPMSQNAMPVLSGPKQGLQLRPWNAQLGPFPIERRPWVGTFLFRAGSGPILDSKFISDWVALAIQIEHQDR